MKIHFFSPNRLVFQNQPEQSREQAYVTQEVSELQKKPDFSKQEFDKAVDESAERIRILANARGSNPRSIESKISTLKDKHQLKSIGLDLKEAAAKKAFIGEVSDDLNKLYNEIVPNKSKKFDEVVKYAEELAEPRDGGIDDYEGDDKKDEAYQSVVGYLTGLGMYDKASANEAYNKFKEAFDKSSEGWTTFGTRLDTDVVKKIANFAEYEKELAHLNLDPREKAYFVGLFAGAKNKFPDKFEEFRDDTLEQIKDVTSGKGKGRGSWSSDKQVLLDIPLLTDSLAEVEISKGLIRNFVKKAETLKNEKKLTFLDGGVVESIMKPETLDKIHSEASARNLLEEAEKELRLTVLRQDIATFNDTARKLVAQFKVDIKNYPEVVEILALDNDAKINEKIKNPGLDAMEAKLAAARPVLTRATMDNEKAITLSAAGALPEVKAVAPDPADVQAKAPGKKAAGKKGAAGTPETPGSTSEITDDYAKNWKLGVDKVDHFFKGKKKAIVVIKSASIHEEDGSVASKKLPKGTELEVIDAPAKVVPKQSSHKPGVIVDEVFVPVKYENKTCYIAQEIIEDENHQRGPTATERPKTESTTAATAPTSAPASAPTSAPSAAPAAAPTSAPTTSAERSAESVDEIARDWEKGREVTKFDLAGYTGKLVIRPGNIVRFRTSTGQIDSTLSVAPGEEMTLFSPNNPAREVNGKLYYEVDYADHSHMICDDWVMKKTQPGEKTGSPEGAFTSPERATAAFEKNHENLKPINPNYLYQLSAIDAYADKPDGARFDLLFNGYMLAFRAFRMPDGKYKISYNGGEIEEPYNSKEEVLRAVNDGSALQKVMLKVLGAKYQFEQHEKVTGTVRNVEKTEKTPPYDYTVELDWNNPNAKVDVRALPFGRIGYRVNRENVAYDGGSMREGVAESLPEFALKMKHIRAWAEEDQHFKTIDTASQHEILFDTITNSYNYNNERAAIGRIINFKIDQNNKVEQVVNATLDWGNFGPTQLFVWLENNQLHYFVNGRKAQTGGISGNFAQMIEGVKKIREAA